MIKFLRDAARVAILALSSLLMAAAVAAKDFPTDSVSFGAKSSPIVAPQWWDKMFASSVRAVEFWFDTDLINGPPVKTGSSLRALDKLQSTPRASLVRVARPDGIFALELLNGRVIAVHIDRFGKRDVEDLDWVPAVDHGHVALVFEPYRVSMYTYGKLFKTFNRMSAPNPRHEARVTFGGPNTATAAGKLRVGGARIWSRLLSAEEIADNAASAPKGYLDPGKDLRSLVFGQVKNGLMLRPVFPRAGLWHEDGAASAGEVVFPKQLASIKDPAHHGQFEDDELFLSVNPIDDDNVQIADSRGGVWHLRRNSRWGSYWVDNEDGRRIGGVQFGPAGFKFTSLMEVDDRLFGPFGSEKSFKLLRRPDDGEGTQRFGDAWIGLAKPPSFGYSVSGCYDSRRMGLMNFAWQGCRRGFFREPPPRSRRYTDGNFNRIIPWGWKYGSIPQSEAHAYATLVTNSQEIGSTITGGSDYHFDLAGISLNHNEHTDSERQRMEDQERIISYQTFTDRRHSIVLDARNVRLDQCFLKDVMRTSYGLSGKRPRPPRWFDESDTDGGHCSQSLTTPITPADLIDRYGTHYAYAITYGARAIARAEMSADSVANLYSSGHDVSTAIAWKVEGSMKVPGTPVSLNGKAGAGGGTQDGSQEWNNVSKDVEFNTTDYFCAGGSGCTEGKVNADSDPVPIYLDLRPMTDLLGPPHFLDSQITIDLRRAVQTELDKIAAEPSVGGEMVSIYQIAFNKLDCNAVSYGSTSKKFTTMTAASQGPFAPSGRFAKLNAKVQNIDEYYLKSVQDADKAIKGACINADYEFKGANKHLLLEIVGIDSNGHETILSTTAPTRISDIVAETARPVILHTPFIDRFVQKTGLPDYKVYFRLKYEHQYREPCADPCAVLLENDEDYEPVVIAGGPQVKLPNFEVFPQFESFSLGDKSSGQDWPLNLTIARGVANFPSGDKPPVGVSVRLEASIKRLEIADRLGFAP